jgi:hypothetical protein
MKDKYRENMMVAKEQTWEAFDETVDTLLLSRDGEQQHEDGYDESKERERLLAPVLKDPQALAILIAGLTQTTVQSFWAARLDEGMPNQ